MNIFGATDTKVYNKKFAAILVLTQYCEKMPTLTYNKVVSTGLYSKLFKALGDSKSEVRNATIEFFKAINKLIIQRDPNERRNFYEVIYNNVLDYLKSSDQYYLHGSLLVISFLLTDSEGLIEDKHEELFQYIISLSEKRNDIIKPQCIEMFPIMAECNPYCFKRYSNMVIQSLLEIAKSKSTMKGCSLKSLGKLSVIIQKHKFDPAYVKEIKLACESEIKAPKSSYFIEAVDTIGNLCKVQGEELDAITDIIDLINTLFRDGLSQNLIITLNELSKINGYRYRKPIQIKLLNVISLILSGRQFSFSRNVATFRKLSDEGSRDRTAKEMSLESGSLLLESVQAKQAFGELNSMEKETMRRLMNREVDSKIKSIIQSDNKDHMVKLALATLSSFDFSDFAESLTHFFDEVVLNFLDNSNDEIREATVKTCSNLTISRDGNRIGSVLEKILKKLLKRFLIVATTDPNHNIRCNMLKHMSSQFDCYLSSKENLLMLFNCMNDSSFEIRDKTLRILGRLADINKSIMYPYLRNLLVSIMSTIEYKGDPKEKEEAIKILNTFVKKCKRVVKDHVECLLKSLLGKMYEKDFNYSLLPDIIEAIGQLSAIDGKPIIPYLEDLIPLILDCIKDEIAPKKREIGLKVLIMIIENTGYVVKPYFHYPELIQMTQSLIQNEPNFNIRKLVYKLLGTAGALDPYLIGKILVFISVEEDEELALNLPLLKEIDILKKYSNKSSIKNLTKRALKESKEINYAEQRAIGSNDNNHIPLEQLGLILENPTLRDIHKTVLESFLYIFKKLGSENKCYLNLIFPPLLNLIRNTGDEALRKEAFDVLKSLIIQIKEHISRYSTSLFSMINEFIVTDIAIGDKTAISKSTLNASALNNSSLSEILDVIGTLNTYAHSYVKDYVYFLIPKVMQIIEKTKKVHTNLAHKGIGLLLTIQNSMLDDYLYLIIPEMIGICTKNNPKMKEAAIQLLKKVIRCKHFEEYIVQIVHSFVKILDESNDKMYIVQFLLDLGTNASNLFSPFLLLVLNSFKKNKIAEEDYELQMQNIAYYSSYNINPQAEDQIEEMYKQEEQIKTIEELNEEAKKASDEYSWRKESHCNYDDLLREFDKHKSCRINDDWIDWLKKTSYHLLKQNPSPLLYAWSSVAEMYMPIISELYNIAFVICFKHLIDRDKEKIITCLISVINNKEVPVIVLQTILNLAEFLEREEELKLFAPATLAAVAERCNASAKALYYKEKDFDRNRYENIDTLISINFDLQQPEAANGLLKLMHNESQNTMKEDWYLKLHQWSEALSMYDQKGNDLDIDDVLGKLQCYTALSDWEKVSDTVEILWDEELKVNHPANETEETKNLNKNKIAEYASYAAWNLNNWDKFQRYVSAIDSKDPYHKYFFQTVINIQKNKHREAEKWIDKCREMIDPKIKTLMGESYRRAYPLILELQYLKELEEIIEYKKLDDEDKKKHLKDLWSFRLEFMAQDVESLQKTLNLRSLVIDISEDTNHYVRLADLWGKKGNAAMCKRILHNLKTEIESNIAVYPKEQHYNISKINFGILKYEYGQGEHMKAIEGLKKLISTEKRISPQWYITLGKWHKEISEHKNELNNGEFKKIISYFHKATEIDEKDNLAWHYYALANYEASKFLEAGNAVIKRENSKNYEEYIMYVVMAVKGLIQSISLGEQDVTKTLQDTLRLLKLWFKHGTHAEIDKLIKSGFDIVGIEVWTQVIPQLLARIDINKDKTKTTMIELLKIICDTYPQTMIYPVSVLSQSNTENRKQVAHELIDMMRRNQKKLINQALFISEELIRAAVLQTESWCEALEEAAMLYFGNNDEKKMLEVLREQYKKFEKEPQTMSEIAFNQNYRWELLEAWDWINKPEPKQEDLLQAWDIYHKLFMRLNKKLKEVSFYELKNVAPNLLSIENTTISVPGIYRCNQKIVTIYKFAPSLMVLRSKQLPRKISMYGSDGKEYAFLLKGREDMRQDERAMQLFGLVNTLLATDPVTQRKDLSIKRYSVIPLSFNAGLLGWVPNWDTLHQLIKDYRTECKIIPSIELKLIDSMCKHFENCPMINKVEIFETVLDKTIGEDLQKVLWMKSANSETWLERRTNYTRSLAVMSMVGYILGLGDRHPSNIMLDRFSGKIVHIDFGDCFEIAMRREKFPEKVPFRLTRMLIKAMEVSGIEGNYRTTCENTMRVLRTSKDSLMAILEAFVYDPLISFKLLAQNLLRTTKAEENKNKIKESPSKLQERATIAAIDKLKNSLVEQVLGMIKDPQHVNFPESHFSRFNNSMDIQSLIGNKGEEVIKQEEDILNETAEVIVERIDSKLKGTDFGDKSLNSEIADYKHSIISVQMQVDKLIKQATSHENLAQSYIGWCPFY